MRKTLRALSALSFVALLGASSVAFWSRGQALAAELGAADAGTDAGTSGISSIFGPPHYMAASKSFGGASLDSAQGFGGLGTPAERGYGGNGVLRGGKSLSISDRLERPKPSVTGALDPGVVTRVIHRNLRQIEYCYEAEAVAHPKTGGTLTLEVVVDGDGSVKTAHVTESSLGRENVHACLTSRAKTWVFPPPKGNTAATVTLPLVLKKEDPP
jgi:hypothetical protein